MKNILITAIGSFSADIVIKNLKKYGYKVIGCDIYSKELIADAYNVDKFYIAPIATNETEYILFVKEVCKYESIQYIIPLTDVEIDVFNNNREYFEKKNIKLCISDKEVVEICRDKNRTAEYLIKKGVTNIIKTQLLSKVDINNIRFPVICKPINGRSSRGVEYIENLNEMKCFISKYDISKYIVQPYIIGRVLTVDVIRNIIEDKIISIPRKEIIRTLNGAGLSVYVFNDNKLKNECEEIARVLNIKGCVNFEFIENEDGNRYFIECNPRFSGGIEFSCIAGYDFVSNNIKCFEDKKIDELNSYKNQYISRKYEEYVTYIED